MTTEQLQNLLAYLGYYTIQVDGIPGKGTTQAVRDFQQAEGLTVDGIAGAKTWAALKQAVANDRFRQADAQSAPTQTTGTWWDDIKWFRREEYGIRCPCGRCGGFPVEPSERLMRMADQVREHFGAPMQPTSTVRCQAHNDELPGSAPNSYHVRGKAMDFSVRGKTAAQVLAYVNTLGPHYAYAIDSSHVHMDFE